MNKIKPKQTSKPRINWKLRYNHLQEVYLKKHIQLKRAYFGWIHTLEMWEKDIKIGLFLQVLSFIMGLLMGVILTKVIWS